MLLPIRAGLVVSVDAFFIGISLGLQKKCKFAHLVVINAFLLGLCFVGFFIAGRVYELIPFDPDLAVGLAFIALGLWMIVQYFAFEYVKKRKGAAAGANAPFKAIVIAGLVMSIEAMLISMGLTLVFTPYASPVIPVTVALAHFGYSSLTFYLAGIKQVQRIPIALSHAISGLALIIYGVMALFVDLSGIVISPGF
jgi:putative Mn2+ efflux pump MntP